MVGIEFRFNELEYIEYRGWGGSVRNAIEQWTTQKNDSVIPIVETARLCNEPR